MPRLLISISLIVLAVAVPRPVFSQDTTDSSPDSSSETADTSDLFLNAYMANEEGQKLESAGDSTKALEKYRYAASLLDQITRDDPNWQPIVVDYRKKRVSENIARLQAQAGGQPSGPDANSVPIDGELPQKAGSTPSLDETTQPPAPPAPTEPEPVPPPSANAPQQIRDQIEELENDLRDSRQQLKAVESQKEDLASRLTDALKQLDQTKVDVSELKGQLKQTQDAYQNALADHSQGPNVQKQYQERISELESALKDAEADREAADEQTADDARRATRARQATAVIVQQRDAATAQAKDFQARYADASKLADKLDAANKQIAALTKDRDAASQRADDLNKQLFDSSKTAAKLADAQKEIAALKATDAATQEKNAEISGQLADARKQIDQIAADRDANQKEITALNGKLADAQTEIVSVKAQRDQIAAQRDQALAELDKAKAAEKRVNELIADNTTLTQKLAADDKIIKNFKSDSPEKDQQIAELRKEVSETKALLASTQQDRDTVQSTLNDLQQQYDSATAELTELKANKSVSESEKKTLTDENDLLRGIVLRELRGEAGRDQAKKLVMAQLSQLGVQSDTLLKRIDYLGEPVVQLTDKEKALFKDPSIDIPDADESSMEFTISAPKQPTPTTTVENVANVTPAAPTAPTAPAPAASPSTPAPASPSNPDTSAAPGTNSPAVDPAPAPAATATPSPTPVEMAKLDTNLNKPSSAAPPVSDETGMQENGLPPAPSPSSAENPESPSSSGADTTGAMPPSHMVPPELMDDAKAAKDAFERTQYRDAERIYEKMLTSAPNNVYVLSNLGVCYFRNGKTQLAEESLKKATAVAPEDTFSWCTLGIVYYQEKRFDDAINSLTRALAIDPKYAVAHNYLGITASQKGWQEAALKELETAVDIDPTYADAYFNLAVIYAMQNPPNKDMARKYYQKAVDLGAEPDAGLEQLIK
jgi:Flp pilus assembly protein TadD/septal ring factor EnvC (AmiA/AmiB activator)